jgi:hypothetical protein
LNLKNCGCLAAFGKSKRDHLKKGISVAAFKKIAESALNV